MLDHPYPVPSNAANWRTTLLIGLFITLFLLVFQPFGLSAFHSSYKYWFIAGYGLVTIAVLTIDHLLLYAYRKTLSGKSVWTVRKQIIQLVLILFTIGAGNFFYSAWKIDFNNPVVGFLVFQFFTTAVGLLPISILTILNENYRNKAFLKEANALNLHVPTQHILEPAESTVYLTGDNEKKPLVVTVSDFLYAESSGNYLEVRFLKEGKVKSILLRTTLTRAEEQMTSHSSIMRCNRAFLVNCAHIVQVKGNAQGLRLQLNHTTDEIPVSRKYINNLRTNMEA